MIEINRKLISCFFSKLLLLCLHSMRCSCLNYSEYFGSMSTQYYPSRTYHRASILANGACSHLCPDVVLIPRTVEEVSRIVKTCNDQDLSLSTRGGGHGYTCQATKPNGVLMDMRQFNTITVDPASEPQTVIVGAGLTWHDVLRAIAPFNLTVVHGQCTSVGVAGFALHGGVHFGGLSELHGLASDNIVGLTAVVANGSVVRMNEDVCSIDGVGSAGCEDLWFALRGAGSSFAVVTQLQFRLHKPVLTSALSLISLDPSDVKGAARFLSSYMESVPQEVSLTFFGLDAYFKAYFFLLQFATTKRKVLSNFSPPWSKPFASLFRKKDKESKRIYFIMEASWNSSLEATFNSVPMIEQLQRLHSTSLPSGLEQGLRVERGVWVPAGRNNGAWAVPSYDLVWGKGHFYGGATGTVGGKTNVELVFDRFLSGFQKQLGSGKDKKCSDCVLVIHRVGPGLKSPGGSVGLGSFNPVRRSSDVWLEMDCGHFFRQRETWGECLNFIEDTQRQVDEILLQTNVSMRYPNVPNLANSNWHELYYGEEVYNRLQRIKQQWDEKDVFNHAQSILPMGKDKRDIVINVENSKNNRVCEKMYEKHVKGWINLNFIGLPVSFAFLVYFAVKLVLFGN